MTAIGIVVGIGIGAGLAALLPQALAAVASSKAIMILGGFLRLARLLADG